MILQMSMKNNNKRRKIIDFVVDKFEKNIEDDREGTMGQIKKRKEGDYGKEAQRQVIGVFK